MMASAQVVETSVNTNNSPSQDYTTNPEDHSNHNIIASREIGNLETNMAEADLSPTTFTSSSASDPDYDISAEDSSENENENTYTEASSDNSSSDPETESSAKSEVFRSSTMPKTKPKPI